MPELKKQSLRDAYVYCESKSWIEKSLNFVAVSSSHRAAAQKYFH